ncbi:adaptor protein MecA [Anaerotignum sp.]
MKIERISENQLKLTLTKDDLKERDIKLEDLISPSEKTQKLFRDIMEQALDEEDFVSENTPLMVEAVPMGTEGIMIIVTKVNNKDKKGNTAADLLQQAQETRRWKKKPLDTLEHAEEKNSDILIYSFPELDDVIRVSLRLDGGFKGESSVYKNDGKYFLVLQGDTYTAEESSDELELVLKEYGQKHVSTPLAKYYLLEHGETIIAEKAVKALAKTFGA